MEAKAKAEYNKIMARVHEALLHPERYTGRISITLTNICNDIDRAIHIRRIG